MNPRNGELVLAVTDDRVVGIRSLEPHQLMRQIGQGYYDTQGHGRSIEASQATGYPRSHTPHGVSPKRMGYGTSLYTALTLGAHLTDDRVVRISMSYHGDGICSEPDRSAAASAWWEKAHQLGLTERQTVGEGEQCEENMDVTEHFMPHHLEPMLDGRVTYVNDVNVDICVEGDEFEADMFAYMTAWERDLIAVEFAIEVPSDYDLRPNLGLRYLLESILDGDEELIDVNADALLAANVIALDEDILKLLSLSYEEAGISQHIDGLWYRWQHQLDPGVESPQVQLALNQSRSADLRSVLEAREATAWDELAMLP